MPKIIRKDHIEKIENALENGYRVFDYEKSLYMSYETFVLLHNLFSSYKKVREINTKTIKTITRDYFVR